MVLNCNCNKKKRTICVGHQLAPIKERSHEMGLLGQEIWYLLEKYKFVGTERFMAYELTSFEKKLKHFLISG